MEKLKMHTPNLTRENIAKIRELFPGCITEAHGEDGKLRLAVDFDQLRQELSEVIVEGPQERYQLNWPGKREALLAANAPIAKTLRPCREESVDFDTTQNLFIEGDNLDALKLLQENYLGKIKMIYIDPPYNTGNDFIYSDNFAASADEFLLESGQKDEEGNRLVANTDSNGRFHSDWLSMMYSRLKLARNLLRDDGAIFISIDDSEQATLKKMCGEIFGENNFVECLIWKKKPTAPNDRNIGKIHEFILVYSKSIDYLSLGLLPRDEKSIARYSNPDNDPKGPWAASDLSANGKGGRLVSSCCFPIKNPLNGEKYFPPEGKCWLYNQEKIDKLIKEGAVGFREKSGSPFLKRYLSEVRPGLTLPTILSDYGFSTTSAAETDALFQKKGIFEFAKPTTLLKEIFRVGLKFENAIFLDFFAGSGTSAQAILNLNLEDEGQRRFILVQLPEECDEKSEAFKAGYKTIAEISKERIRRAGKKIKEENPLATGGLDTGFRVLKVDSSNLADVYYTADTAKQDTLNFAIDNIKPDRKSEDLLFQVLLDWGIELSLPIKKSKVAGLEVYFVDENALAACFVKKGEISDDFCKELAKLKPLRVVFRDSGFKDDSAKINAEQIFKLMSPHTDLKTI